MKLTTLLAAAPLLCSAAALAAPAASSGLAQTKLEFDASVNDATPARLDGACRINVLGISDARPNKDAISVDAPLTAGPIAPWISQSLDSLKAYGFTVSHNAAPVADALNLDVRVIRTYTWYGSMRINGMVAIDVDSGVAGGTVEKYRGHGSKSNMAGMDSEHVTTLNFAVNNMVNTMARSLQQRCNARKASAT